MTEPLHTNIDPSTRRTKLIARGGRLRYMTVRILQAVFVVWAAFTLAFFLLYWLPGDAILAKLAGDGVDISSIPAHQIAALRAEFGLDRPLIVQYLDHLLSALRGDLGVSVRSGEPVTVAIGNALPSTLALAGAALVLSVVVGCGLALLATFTRLRWLRGSLTSLTAVGISVPSFWIGLILLAAFSFQLHLFPAAGDNGFSSLVLPAITLAIPTGAVLSRVLIGSMSTALAEPYVTTVKSKGASRATVHFRHALRNALFPVITMAALLIGQLIAGSVIVETVFSRNGLGRLTVAAVESQDTPVILGLVITGALIFVVVNLIVDVLYPVLDPRVRSVKAVSR